MLLDTTAGDATWLVTVTLLVATIGTPVMARLADMHGRRKLLLIAMALLVSGSVIAAVTDSFALILAGRALQGFASSALPIGIGLLSGLVSPIRTRLGVALMSGTVALGSGLGLTIAGPWWRGEGCRRSSGRPRSRAWPSSCSSCSSSMRRPCATRVASTSWARSFSPSDSP
ncbi:MFS transporter [Microbacterium sp. NIBRBAC000506063]|uniref:MFS transporter n=1 Tax=Microbacterium sp. NIBRBAC000506063 TaxID=2734618 RepID=UPI001BB5988B|nr:MFS transporter [Microbacterium sp. NIBRBAC000506063]QTV79053.1 MFS transporter [Microbacterium sp. NIBRBAC000506063]